MSNSSSYNSNLLKTVDNPFKVISRSPILWGGFAGMLMLSIYIGVLSISNTFEHAIDQFMYMRYWLTALILGFSLQVGLFKYMRNRMLELKASGASGGSIAASGGMSSTAMVACCAHHLTELLPALGLSAAAIFVTRFQGTFLLIGVISNILGIIYMLSVIQKNNLVPDKNGMLRFLLRFNMRKAFAISGIIGALTLIVSIYDQI
jgi:hypothetical protein